MKCPICNNEVGVYHEVTFTEPFVHNVPFDGLNIYGCFSSPKEVLCFENNFLHFAFYDHKGDLVDHRLVQLGVEYPNTPSPTDEFFEDYEFEVDEDDHDSKEFFYEEYGEEDELPF